MADGDMEAVLRFWFVENGVKQWFAKDDAFDRAIQDRFAKTHDAAADGRLDHWVESRDGRLALILVLDQFSRNLFRGTAEAFAYDERALAIARKAVAIGDHTVLPRDRALFVFLPFEHSEALADQKLCHALLSAYGTSDTLQYAQQHLDIIERFGRFPHRNAVLGRESTPEEVDFLEKPGSSF